MADINAVDLTAETLASLDGTENVVGFDTAEGKKIPISVLADYAIQKKTHDIAGNTQTVKAAVDNSISHVLTSSQSIAANTDIDDLTTPGTYFVPNSTRAGTLTHWPTGQGGRLEVISVLATTGTASSERLRQYVYVNGVTTTYQRVWNGSTWSTWEQEPTRTEMDSVTAKVNGQQIPDNSSLNNITTPGRYYTMSASGTATITDKPSDLDTAFTMDVQTRGGYLNQIIYNYTGSIYIRGKISSGWFDWSKLPTRAEMDAAVKKYYEDYTGATNRSVVVSFTGESGMFVLFASSFNYNANNARYVGFVNVSSSSWMGITPIYQLSNSALTVEVNETNRTVTVTASNTSAPYLRVSVLRL